VAGMRRQADFVRANQRYVSICVCVCMCAGVVGQNVCVYVCVLGCGAYVYVSGLMLSGI